MLAKAFGMMELAYDSFVRTCDDDNVCLWTSTRCSSERCGDLHSPLTPEPRAW